MLHFENNPSVFDDATIAHVPTQSASLACLRIDQEHGRVIRLTRRAKLFEALNDFEDVMHAIFGKN